MEKFFTVKDNFKDIIKDNLNCDHFKIEKISNGWTNFVYSATKDDGTKYFFRFPRNNFFSDALVKEVRYTSFVKDKISFGTANLFLGYSNGRPYSFHRCIEGKNLYDVLDNIPENKIDKLCDDICKLIFEIQSIDMSPCEDLILLSDFLNNLADISAEKGCYDYSVHNELIREEKTENLVLNHGDLNPGNIILDKDFNMVAVLDFAFITKSSKFDDISRIIGRLPERFKQKLIVSFEKISLSNEVNSL